MNNFFWGEKEDKYVDNNYPLNNFTFQPSISGCITNRRCNFKFYNDGDIIHDDKTDEVKRFSNGCWELIGYLSKTPEKRDDTGKFELGGAL